MVRANFFILNNIWLMITKITKPTKGGNCLTVTKFILQKEVNLLQLHLLQPLIVILVMYIVMLFEAF